MPDTFSDEAANLLAPPIALMFEPLNGRKPLLADSEGAHVLPISMTSGPVPEVTEGRIFCSRSDQGITCIFTFTPVWAVNFLNWAVSVLVVWEGPVPSTLAQ